MNQEKPLVTIQAVGNAPVFAYFNTREEALLAMINLNNGKVELQNN